MLTDRQTDRQTDTSPLYIYRQHHHHHHHILHHYHDQINYQHPDLDRVDLRGVQQHPLLLQHHRAHVRILRYRRHHQIDKLTNN